MAAGNLQSVCLKRTAVFSSSPQIPFSVAVVAALMMLLSTGHSVTQQKSHHTLQGDKVRRFRQDKDWTWEEGENEWGRGLQGFEFCQIVGGHERTAVLSLGSIIVFTLAKRTLLCIAASISELVKGASFPDNHCLSTLQYKRRLEKHSTVKSKVFFLLLLSIQSKESVETLCYNHNKALYSF